ncbi:hypothetical protein CDAR_96801 [Caerostris darwini]|uniref:Uncharacterized protein n=1 Tax=Caerostris darwini TaxID=1538125 RepID=A0AAV4QW21_9ARAC|nr:hypothetical protein CDAR_96801 [Caerostris darwini]
MGPLHNPLLGTPTHPAKPRLKMSPENASSPLWCTLESTIITLEHCNISSLVVPAFNLQPFPPSFRALRSNNGLRYSLTEQMLQTKQAKESKYKILEEEEEEDSPTSGRKKPR